MLRHLDPEPVARFAQAEVAAGHYASIADALTAGVEALPERAEAEQLSYGARIRGAVIEAGRFSTPRTSRTHR